MPALGSISLVAAFVLACYGLVAAVLAIRTRLGDLVVSARNALLGMFGLITLASLTLIAGFLSHNYELAYVAQHSSNEMPPVYVIASFYSGQQGSLLYWCWTLAIFSALVVWLSWKGNRRLMPYVVGVLCAMEAFFLFLLAFIQSPFATLPFHVDNGNGLNPVLQDKGMLIHPPMMLMGYMSWSIPFAFGLAALISGKLDFQWLRSIRRWALAAFCIQSVGLLLGAWWAYHVLGWGGYWGWDPVENAAFMPWLAGTAFLHSVMVQERRGMLKVWNLTLIMLAYLLAVFGTFIVRSGILTSVHAFAQSSIGPYLFGWLALSIAVSTGLLVWRLPRLQGDSQFESLASREAGFLFNNWLLIAVVVAVFSGTVFPIISEAVRGEKITVGPPFFGAVNGPIFLALMVTMGVGPLLPWRRTSGRPFIRNFAKPVSATVVALALMLVFGLRSPGAVLGYGACVFVFATLVFEFYRGTLARQRVTGKSTLGAFADLFVHHNRRYGGYLVHVGMVVAAVAIVGSQFYQLQRQVTLERGQSATIGNYRLTFNGLAAVRDPEKSTTYAGLSLADGETIHPGKSVWARDDKNPTSEIVIRSTPFEDLYVVLGEWTAD
ncbi:MAG TPA: cytochrome c-type biogenesis CcmF C-terminal domain-containing protein, partial [Chloroflexota bacterium]|nr:cytochrome c-type biogenesis CcmF C-terminal domain-containing protein [Chloroflexota bacterium]